MRHLKIQDNLNETSLYNLLFIAGYREMYCLTAVKTRTNCWEFHICDKEKLFCQSLLCLLRFICLENEPDCMKHVITGQMYSFYLLLDIS